MVRAPPPRRRRIVGKRKGLSSAGIHLRARLDLAHDPATPAMPQCRNYHEEVLMKESIENITEGNAGIPSAAGAEDKRGRILVPSAEDIRRRLDSGESVPFGQYVSMLRRSKGVRQRELAHRADRSLSFIGNIEAGECRSWRVMPEVIRRIADALGQDGDHLLVLSRVGMVSRDVIGATSGIGGPTSDVIASVLAVDWVAERSGRFAAGAALFSCVRMLCDSSTLSQLLHVPEEDRRFFVASALKKALDGHPLTGLGPGEAPISS